ncbi:hypothetical protein EUA59_00890 [TM7 phylum sp. oral taxon 346]|nr:hypothetical protein EUA59_00890 [TM7 phylum sp. oral taxon 346]
MMARAALSTPTKTPTPAMRPTPTPTTMPTATPATPAMMPAATPTTPTTPTMIPATAPPRMAARTATPAMMPTATPALAAPTAPIPATAPTPAMMQPTAAIPAATPAMMPTFGAGWADGVVVCAGGVAGVRTAAAVLTLELIKVSRVLRRPATSFARDGSFHTDLSPSFSSSETTVSCFESWEWVSAHSPRTRNASRVSTTRRPAGGELVADKMGSFLSL